MKLKVEFIDGNIELVRVEDVTLNIASQRLNFVYDYYGDITIHNLKTVSRVTVDNEVIYDYLGRKENHKKEERK